MKVKVRVWMRVDTELAMTCAHHPARVKSNWQWNGVEWSGRPLLGAGQRCALVRCAKPPSAANDVARSCLQVPPGQGAHGKLLEPSPYRPWTHLILGPSHGVRQPGMQPEGHDGSS